MNKLMTKENKALLVELVRTDFKLRYQGSALGYAWSLLKPLLMFLVLYVVFVYFLSMDRGMPHFPVYLLLGIVLWNFFTEMTVQTLGSVVGRGDLIRKVKIPRWMIPLSTSFSALINLALSLVIVAIFAIWNQVTPSWSMLMILPTILLFYVFALGCSLYLSAAYVKFRDVSYIWDVILQAGFYATPIIYALTLIPNVHIQRLLLLNPLAVIIQDARHAVIGDSVPTIWSMWGDSPIIILPFAAIAICIVIGVMYFKSQSKSFAENI